MARNRILDYMQTHRFWLFDVVPSLSPPFYVLGTPFLAFSSITAPEYTAETETLTQMNSMFKRYTYSGGSAGPITLSRGVRGFDDSMWTWMYRAITGLEVTNRHLLLLHFTNIRLFDFSQKDLIDGIDMPTEAGVFVPGKAFLLWDCLPTRWKSGSDFDAKSGEVSIEELEVQPSAVSAFTLIDPV